MLGVAIDNPNSIDIMSTSAASELVLTIADHFDWTDTQAHQLALQDKLNSYLRFVESGEVYEHRPSAIGSPIVIKVACKWEPDAAGVIFLEKARAIVEGAGFGFKYLTVPDH
jgi:hypothetical protein